ncbi:proactivator polypeptide-like 1 [Neltuma alba]|uniref:proactivator polypeptide-like 1 n=1 Tax=Neltuma alba TaxID=207710 RepID=UPI0010A59D21|nr:proactivator polypeptide-like 1 [Prosopis alba]
MAVEIGKGVVPAGNNGWLMHSVLLLSGKGRKGYTREGEGERGHSMWCQVIINRAHTCCPCEEYASEALDFLTKKETQDEVIDILYHTCHKLRPLEQECLNLVDLYAPRFFSKLASLQPGELCKKANLCQRIAKISSQVQEDSCGFCRDAVSEVLVKLKDPDTELDVIETLLKACNSIEKYAQKCKRLVFAYGPVMLVKAEKFLERTDICTALRACKASTIDMEAKDMKETALLSDF